MSTVAEALESARNAERLAALRRLNLLDTPAEEDFDRITRLASKIMGSPIALISLVDADRQFFKSFFGLPEPWASLRETPLSHSFCKHVVADGAPLVVADARRHPVLRHNLAVSDLGIVAYLGMPLLTVDGVAVGTLSVVDTRPRAWRERDVEVLHELSHAVVTEMERRAQLETRQKAEAALQRYATTLELTLEERTRELEQAHGRLGEIDRLIFKFMDDIRHELSTPATNLALYLDLWAHSPPEKHPQYMQVLRSEAQRLTHLLNSIFKYSQLDLGDGLTHVDLNAVVAAALDDPRRHKETGKLHLRFTPSEQPLYIHGDQNLLVTMVVELVNNALQYTMEGEVDVRVSGAEQPEQAMLQIEDSGIGITSEDLPYIFKRFYRGYGASQSTFPGMGLGLAVVEEIVKYHKGQIEVESQPGRGSTFVVYLPLASGSGEND